MWLTTHSIRKPCLCQWNSSVLVNLLCIFYNTARISSDSSWLVSLNIIRMWLYSWGQRLHFSSYFHCSDEDATHLASRCTSVQAGCHRRCPHARGLQIYEPPLQPDLEPHPAPHSYCCLSSSSVTEIHRKEGLRVVTVMEEDKKSTCQLSCLLTEQQDTKTEL